MADPSADRPVGDLARHWWDALCAEPRTLVLGCPGSGKTTLSLRLAKVTGRPLFHLDDEHWGPGWQRPGDAEWRRRQRELVSRAEWVIEGNYLPTVPLRAARAGAAVVVDTPTAVCLHRAVRRALRIRAGDLSALPAAVRAAADPGSRVVATQDFPGLLRKILRFRRRDFWTLMEAAGAGAGAQLVVVVGGRFPGRRAAAVRRGLAERGRPGAVVDAATFDAALHAA